MKKYISLLAITLCFTAMQAQDSSDAYRYAQDNINGTARFRAMSGAFGALGGDLSAINVNPAGSVVFANNQIAFSGSSFNTKNKSNYFGKQTSENNNTLDLNQAGAVFVFENNHENSDWRKFSIAINYENTNNFENSIFSAGTNANNSIDNYFLNNANGLKLSTINDTTLYYDELTFQQQQAYLGYLAYVINESPTYDDNTNRSYVSLVAPGGNYYQTNSTEATGYNGKVTFNAATQYKDILMLGINLNAHFIDYKSSNRFIESNNNNTSAVNYLVNRIAFNNDLHTYGSGFSLQLGAILKPIKELRLGLSYQTPTWYKLTDELQQSISAVSGNTTGNLDEDIVNPNPGRPTVYPIYKLQTPGKLTGSFAYIFGKRGLISFDYSLKNYSNLEFSPKNDDYFQSVNNSLSSVSREHASEYRVGGEYKIKQFSLRGGYHFEQSPYKNATTIGNLTGYSGGIGYNFGNKKLDLAYSTSKRDANQQFFTQGLTDAAKINTTRNNITLTFAFEL
jgi:hypothetical protein